MKKLFLFIAIPIVAVVGALIALVLLVNPNQFKPMIVEQAKNHTGLDLVIEGDIGWQFFPSIGFEIGKTELRNPEGFSKPNMLKVDSIVVDVSVAPLFSKQLEVGNIVLDGAEFSLETLKDGRKNIDALTQAQAEQVTSETSEPGTETPPQETSSSSPRESEWAISLAGVSISNSAVEVQDKQTGSYTKLYDVSLNLSEFAFDKWTKAEFAAKGENNEQKFSAKGDVEFRLAKGMAEYALRNINVESSFNDPATKMDRIALSLATFEFDKTNALTYELKGRAAELDIDMKGAGSLTVDKAMTNVVVDKLTLDGTLKGNTLPQSPMKLNMASDIRFDLEKSHLSVLLNKLTANELAFDGKANVTLGDIHKVRFTLHSPNIDLDEFLGLQQTSDSTKNTGAQGSSNGGASKPSGNQEVEPDLSALKSLDVKGDIAIDKFKASNAKMQNVKVSFSVNRGVAVLHSFTSNLYQGSISASGQLDARKSPATYNVSNRVKGVAVQPLLIDLADNNKLEGTGNIDVNVSGSSLKPSAIQKNLKGTVLINFADGAVNGINVAQLIRENYAKFKGKSFDGKEGVQKTDFSALKATLNLNQGNVTTNDMNLQSPLLRLRGKGKANYINQTVDFTVSTSVVGSLEGQGGKDIDELRDVTIPINVSGRWDEPKFKLVFDDVLKQKAQKELDRGLEKLDEKLGEKIKDEKTKEAVNNLIKGLFN